MNYLTEIQKAIDYIETHLCEEIDVKKLARDAVMSSFYFQRIFGIICGVTLGDYIRFRRLTFAGIELSNTNLKVIDIAFRYGYDSPEGFTRAFTNFHGISPKSAKANKDKLKFFSRISLELILNGGITMDYKIAEKPEMILTGYKKYFTGVPYGKDRSRQEEKLFMSTRAKQWLLRGAAGASTDGNTEICVITNMDSDGYDFYYAVELDEYERKNMYNSNITGIDFMNKFGYENITIPKSTYAIFSTDKMSSPVNDYIELREAITNEIIANDDFLIANAPELAIYHWFDKESKKIDT